MECFKITAVEILVAGCTGLRWRGEYFSAAGGFADFFIAETCITEKYGLTCEYVSRNPHKHATTTLPVPYAKGKNFGMGKSQGNVEASDVRPFAGIAEDTE